MTDKKFILSEKPDALDGALEWLDEEIKREEESRNLSKKVEDHIRPLVLKIAQKNGIAG